MFGMIEESVEAEGDETVVTLSLFHDANGDEENYNLSLIHIFILRSA